MQAVFVVINFSIEKQSIHIALFLNSVMHVEYPMKEIQDRQPMQDIIFHQYALLHFRELSK
jgi:hypothetical protein